jgi:hypothetical protein
MLVTFVRMFRLLFLRRSSYTLLEKLQWTFGQKLIMLDGTCYWATDSQYPYMKNNRRDNLLLDGIVSVEVHLTNGNVVHRNTALCCQAICFLELRNVGDVLDVKRLPKDIQAEIVDDLLTMVLVRWFEPHPSATERNLKHLPLCPPPFNINHALWKYAESKNQRAVFFSRHNKQPTKTFYDQSYMFGKTRREQLHRLHSESHAYYGLIKVSSIVKVSFMSPEFEYRSCEQTSTWLQTIVTSI